MKTLFHFKVLLKYFSRPPFFPYILGWPPSIAIFSHAPPPPLNATSPPTSEKMNGPLYRTTQEQTRRKAFAWSEPKKNKREGCRTR